MVKFYNNIENEETFLAVVNCLKKLKVEYEGYDTSDTLDEMNDFMDVVSQQLLDNINIYCWFSKIYNKWYEGCCCELSVETINKSFEAAMSGKHFYDVGNYLDGWDKDLVEYVLKEKDAFVILNDKDDYDKFLYKYNVTVECPSGYYRYDLDLWRPMDVVKEEAVELLEDSVKIDFYENDNGEYEDEEGNIIDVKENAIMYAESLLMEVDYETVEIE